jgi:hypothetical protein
MLGATAGDVAFEPAMPELSAVLVVVAAAVGDHRLRLLPRMSRLPGDRLDPINQREQLGDVGVVTAGQSPSHRTDMAAIDNPGGPIDPARPVEPPQQLPVQQLPESVVLPLLQPAMRCRGRAA